MSFRRSSSTGSIMKALNMGLSRIVFETKNPGRKKENVNKEEAGLSMLDNYKKGENGLGLRLRYSEAL